MLFRERESGSYYHACMYVLLYGCSKLIKQGNKLLFGERKDLIGFFLSLSLLFSIKKKHECTRGERRNSHFRWSKMRTIWICAHHTHTYALEHVYLQWYHEHYLVWYNINCRIYIDSSFCAEHEPAHNKNRFTNVPQSGLVRNLLLRFARLA